MIRSMTLMPVSSSSSGGRLVLVGRRRAVDRHAVSVADRAGLVDRLAEHVHDAAEGLLAHRHLDRLAGVLDAEAALEALAGAHRDAAHDAVAELLLDLEGQPVVDLKAS
jgi:hypothetical protein